MTSAIVSLCAFLITVALVRLLRRPAIQAGLVDVPGGRKAHDGDVPLIGGLAIFGGVMLTTATAWSLVSPPLALFIGLTLMLVVGFLDDLRELSARFRLLVQIAAAVVMAVGGGAVIHNLGDLIGLGNIHLSSYLGVAFTTLCVVGFVNAINMADGVDGLAGGISASALSLLAVAAAVTTGSVPHLLVMLLGAIAGFLLFNMRHPGQRRASIFLGDAGSMTLGFVLAWFAVELSQGTHAALSPIAVAWIFALPTIDTVSLMVRRILRGRSPFQPDTEHFHHILQRIGLTPGETTWVMIGVSTVLGVIGLLGDWVRVPEPVMLAGFLLLFALHLYFVLHAWRMAQRLRRMGLAQWLRSVDLERRTRAN